MDYCIPNGANYGKSGDAVNRAIDDLKACFADPFGGVTTGSGKYKHPAIWCCYDVGTCCVAMCCNVCVASHTLAKINGTTCEEECVACCVMNCVGCGCCYGLKMREKVRAKYGIAGSRFHDILMACCCPGVGFQDTNQVENKTPLSDKLVLPCPPALQKICDDTRAKFVGGGGGGDAPKAKAAEAAPEPAAE